MLKVAVEGNICAGKTSFLEHLKTSYGASCVLIVHDEPMENWRNLHGHNILDMFYNDQVRYAFMMQVVATTNSLTMCIVLTWIWCSLAKFIIFIIAYFHLWSMPQLTLLRQSVVKQPPSCKLRVLARTVHSSMLRNRITVSIRGLKCAIFLNRHIIFSESFKMIGFSLWIEIVILISRPFRKSSLLNMPFIKNGIDLKKRCFLN